MRTRMARETLAPTTARTPQVESARARSRAERRATVRRATFGRMARATAHGADR
jgi:hypothetical protein